jgi:hypothetical protein
MMRNNGQLAGYMWGLLSILLPRSQGSNSKMIPEEMAKCGMVV